MRGQDAHATKNAVLFTRETLLFVARASRPRILSNHQNRIDIYTYPIRAYPRESAAKNILLCCVNPRPYPVAVGSFFSASSMAFWVSVGSPSTASGSLPV